MYNELIFVIQCTFQRDGCGLSVFEMRKPNYRLGEIIGEGANIDRRLVPYHGKSNANPISHRVYIYIYIYMHQRPPHARHRKIWPW